MSNVATTRGANRIPGSTLACIQFPLTRRCTASTYHGNSDPKFPPPIPLNPSPRCVADPAPSEPDVYTSVGATPPPHGTAFSGGGALFSRTFDGRVLYLG